ncbi:uncharacterized protein METZ01_LOCUS6188, partial [marine metagenome]
VVGALRADLVSQRPGAPTEHLTHGSFPGELRFETSHRRHLRLEVIGDVDHERRRRGILTEEQTVHNLLGPMSVSRCIVVLERREEGGVVGELGCDAVIRMPALTAMGHDHPRPQLSDQSHDDTSGSIVVHQPCIAEPCVLAHGQTHHLGRASSLLFTDLYRPASCRFAPCEVENAHSLSVGRCL